ncbi:hypothetical protein SAMN05421754_100536 [Nitrosomonas sp. Nm58]|nr:hypothetical protein SAMN05421754_100536 [Nitrosomonas sp. Nm58]
MMFCSYDDLRVQRSFAVEKIPVKYPATRRYPCAVWTAESEADSEAASGITRRKTGTLKT